MREKQSFFDRSEPVAALAVLLAGILGCSEFIHTMHSTSTDSNGNVAGESHRLDVQGIFHNGLGIEVEQGNMPRSGDDTRITLIAWAGHGQPGYLGGASGYHVGSIGINEQRINIEADVLHLPSVTINMAPPGHKIK